MRTIEESLQILDNMPAFQQRFDTFKIAILSSIEEGLTYRGNPVHMRGDCQKNKKSFLDCIVDGKKKTLITDMPKQLFDAGYRFEQFGPLFITPFTTSIGNIKFLKLKGTIISALKYKLLPNEVYDHDTDGILLALIGRFIKPKTTRTPEAKIKKSPADIVNTWKGISEPISIEIPNTLVVKQTAIESVSDSHHEYAARSEQIEKRKAEFQQKRLKAQQA